MAEEVVQQKNPEEPAQQIIADNSTEQAEPAAEVQTDQQEAGAARPGIWAADCCCYTGYGCEA